MAPLKYGSIRLITHPTTAVSPSSYYAASPTPTPGLLQKGRILFDGHLPLPSDILFEYDRPIVLRDDVTIYCDVYRPPQAAPGTVPAILVAGPFGKNGGPNKYHFDKTPWRMGCPRAATSGLEKFEGPDPAYWCSHNYAIVHSDSRGTWKSNGDVVLGGTQEGEDGYDIVEWIAQQPWCNGKVSMAGNSYLAQTQWFVGAQKPPSLACLAPWEGWSDVYNDCVRRGGIPNPGFIDGLLRTNLASVNGVGQTEDLVVMTETYPLWNEYWSDRRPALKEISCPLYIVASWTNALHTAGTFRGWTESGSQEKWLRVHNSHEWPDLYDSRNVEDLRAFYDYFMKGVCNGWEHTAPVRLSIIDAGLSGRDIINRPEAAFPLLRQQSLRLHLDTRSSALSLSTKPPTTSSTASYDAVTGSLTFTFKATSRLEIVGYSKLHIYMSAEGAEDMDIFVVLQKHSSDGKLLESPLVDVGRGYPDPEKERKSLWVQHAEDHSKFEGYFNSGPSGMLRASHRALDVEKSTEFQPIYRHDKEEMLKSGEAVLLDIAIWPYGMVVKEGEELRLTVGGVNTRQHLRPDDVRSKLRNTGRHVVHTGVNWESYLLLPMIPRPEIGFRPGSLC